MIYIATVFWKHPLWTNMFFDYLEKNLVEEHKVFCYTTNVDLGEYKSKTDFCVETDITSHPGKLNKLAGEISKVAKDDDYIIFIDNDAFPIKPFWPDIKPLVGKHKFVAVQRKENNSDKQPHPCFAVTTVGFWKSLPGDWGSGGTGWLDSKGRRIKDTGSLLLDRLQSKNVNWHPLLRTNTYDLHPIFFGVYGDFLYHHGAGSRPKRTRLDLDFPDAGDRIKENANLSNNVYKNIKLNPNYIQDTFCKKKPVAFESQEEATEIGYAFATVVHGDGFYDLFRVFLYSLLKHNPWIQSPFIVFHNGLKRSQQVLLRRIYPKVTFRKIDIEKYKSHEKGYSKFWSLEVFNVKDYDKIIFLDCDLLCIGGIDSLLDIQGPVAMYKEQRRNMFNSGVVVVDKSVRNKKVYEGLLNFKLSSSRFGKDQQVLNGYFDGRITNIPQKYNCLVSEAPSKLNDISLVHYIYKPTSKSGRNQLRDNLLKLWEQYKNDYRDDWNTESIG